MRDLADRLRNFAIWDHAHSHYNPVPVCQEGADEIERLRKALGEILEEVGTSTRANKIASAALNQQNTQEGK